ncbi:DUF378 domain-containing protein [Clostridium magnum]|uniref:DUF378 domain-containing protein n=1 Tax=Clostridium magnum DSM 2767 TaxID=1121326 RepID=A0A162V3K2_9CLOT|nr:DUF378 domain-containing protein [Clostridium magnum]KZL94511.1 hypothetical protein CLMAG_15640 [Clostridium magnum DSM 2767]SHI21603.1 hypothetical protein SAMN02745944_03269 [Clostridium magnum DSM 2767]
MYKFKLIDKVSLILVIIGAINWGLIGLFNFNLVDALFGQPTNLIGRIIYILIGVSGVDMLMLLFKTKKL